MWGVLQSSMKVELVVLGKSDLWKREKSGSPQPVGEWQTACVLSCETLEEV